MYAPKHREVRLGSRSQRIKCIKYSKGALGNERAVVFTHSSNALGYPHRISAKKLVIFGRTEVSCGTKLNNEVIDYLLCAYLVEYSRLHISLYVNIKEGRAASKGHSRTVLLLVCRKVSKIGPLHRLFCIFGRSAYIKAVKFCHFLELFKEVYLAVKLLKKLYIVGIHYSFANSSLICRLLLYKSVNAVERNSSVVAYNSSSAVCVGKSRKERTVSCRLHFVGVYTENTVVMRRTVSKIFLYLARELIAVSLTRRACHTNTAKGVYASLKRLVGLKTYDYLIILINVSCRIVAKRRNRSRINGKHSAVIPLF